MVLNIETISYKNVEIIFLPAMNLNKNMVASFWRLFSSLAVDKILISQLRKVFNLIIIDKNHNYHYLPRSRIQNQLPVSSLIYLHLSRMN